MVNDFNFVTPESEGIPSGAILDFLDYIEELSVNLHSFIMVRHGNIVCEGYYAPFDKDYKNRIYSCSKSLVSYAVGKLWGEGLCDLRAPLISYFPEIKDPDPVMATVTVEDALTMCIPQSSCPYGLGDNSIGDTIVTDGDWTRSFFSSEQKCDKPKGVMFRYHSQASYVLGDMVKHITGKDFLDYLRPELDKIGVSPDIECIRCPDGVQWASSGVLCTTRDFAKMGELLLTKGEYKGEQLLPREYMERACSKMVSTLHSPTIYPGSWGYGYQIWQERYGFGMHGMRGQVVHCFPDKDFMVVMTSNEPDYAAKLYRGATMVYKRISDSPLEDNPTAYRELSERVSGLKINRAFGAAHSPLESALSGKTFKMNANKKGIDNIRLDFGEKQGTLSFTKLGEEKKLAFGYGEFADTKFPDKTFYGMTMNKAGGRDFRALVTASWPLRDSLLIVCDIMDTTPGTLTIAMDFFENKVAIDMSKSAEAILAGYEVCASGVIEEQA